VEKEEGDGMAPQEVVLAGSICNLSRVGGGGRAAMALKILSLGEKRLQRQGGKAMGPSKFFGILDGMGWDAVGGMLSRFRLISVWVPGLERVCFCPAPAASRGRGRKNAKVRKCSARFGEGLRDREGLPKICAKFGASGCT
jgi:hypothetical protein